MRRSLVKRILIVLFLLLLFAVVARSIQDLGNRSFANPGAPSLMVSVRGPFTSPAFVGAVGGMSFDQVAKPARGLAINKLYLHYRKRSKDGNRMELKINGQAIDTQIYDWQLLPIAKYADSEYYACITLFGKLNDEKLQKDIMDAAKDAGDKEKVKIINYHPKFVNTLLGLRLFQMDALILTEERTDLPRIDGKYILGKGEREPNLFNRNAAFEFSNYLAGIENDLQDKFHSYIITDYTRDITFDIRNNSLNVSGDPYYYCWKYKSDNVNYNPEYVRENITKSLISEFGRQKTKDYQGWLAVKLVDTLEKYKANYTERMELLMSVPIPESREDKINLYKGFDIDFLKGSLLNIKVDMDAHTVIYLKEFSRRMSSRPDILKRVNPAVWDATVTTMRYAAFFRYIKNNHPYQWNKFIKEIRSKKSYPSIQTPTVMYPKNYNQVGNLVKAWQDRNTKKGGCHGK